MRKDSIKKTIAVAIILCIFCSILVSGASVLLKPRQIENKELDIKRNLLLSAGLLKDQSASKEEILERFKQIKPVVIDLKTGRVAPGIDPATFDQKVAAKKPSENKAIDPSIDPGIKYRAKHSKIFVVRTEGDISHIILPVHGKGLWSTMYGFVALSTDTKTIKGFGFYDHGETPGLGGEVDNAKWKASWIGKVVYNDDYQTTIKVIKGLVDPTDPQAIHKIDGLSGATLTSNGVNRLMNYWLSEDGFAPFLANFRQQGSSILEP